MRLIVASFVLILGLGVLQAKPVQPPKKDDPKEQPKADAFKPVDINAELNANDPKDAKLDAPSKRYTVALQKDKTYIIDLVCPDQTFDPYLRLLDKGGNQLAEDDDAGGNLNSRIVHSATKSEDHQVVVTTFNGDVGKFNLRVRELVLKAEAKPRDVGKDGISITDQINQNTVSDLGKLGKLYSVNLKKGQTYTIDLASGDMDSYLYLFGADAKILAQDDDSGGDLNSRITYRADRDGVVHIIATSLDGDETGEFTLKVRQSE
jgi:hypothetical protein